jgi:peptide chain release factor 3
VTIRQNTLNYQKARWIRPDASGQLPDLKRLSLTSTTLLVMDKEDSPVLLFESDWAITWALDRNTGLVLESIHKGS